MPQCARIVKGVGVIPDEQCKAEGTIRLGHPLHGDQFVCEPHEPKRCLDCEGHILGGECYCEN